MGKKLFVLHGIPNKNYPVFEVKDQMMVKKVYESINKIAKMVLLVLLFTLHDPKNGYVGVLQAKTGTG